jgi:hypothetical protein
MVYAVSTHNKLYSLFLKRLYSDIFPSPIGGRIIIIIIIIIII